MDDDARDDPDGFVMDPEQAQRCSVKLLLFDKEKHETDFAARKNGVLDGC